MFCLPIRCENKKLSGKNTLPDNPHHVLQTFGHFADTQDCVSHARRELKSDTDVGPEVSQVCWVSGELCVLCVCCLASVVLCLMFVLRVLWV